MASGKIPVFRSVGAGTYFALVRIIAVVRGGLIPTVISAIAFVVYYSVLGDAAFDPEQADHADPRILRTAIIFNLVTVLAGLMLMVGLTKAYFREPIGPLYFWPGAGELRLFVASIIVGIITILVCLIPIIALVAATQGFSGSGSLDQYPEDGSDKNSVSPEMLFDGPLMAVGIIVVVLLAFFLLVRFSLVLPVIVKEKRIGVGRSWTLTRGNVWRLIGLTILIGIVSSIVGGAILTAAGYSPLAAFFAEIAQSIGDGTFDMAMLTTPMGAAAVAVITVGYLVVYAHLIGAFNFAYESVAGDVAPRRRRRAAEPEPEPEPEPDPEPKKRTSRRRRRR